MFGTCVDWRTSVKRALEQKTGRTDAADLAQKWRQGGNDRFCQRVWSDNSHHCRHNFFSKGYIESVTRLAQTLEPERDEYPELDDIFRGILDDTVLTKDDELNEQDRRELSQCWHKLLPWPDTNKGLALLSEDQGLTTGTLSNGSVRLLIDLKKYGHMPFDVIFSSELFRSYKPSPHIYKGAVKLLGLQPHQVCMVAAHAKDLYAAKRCGLMTAFVYRPGEGHAPDEIQPGDASIDIIAKDFIHLAQMIAKVRDHE